MSQDILLKIELAFTSALTIVFAFGTVIFLRSALRASTNKEKIKESSYALLNIALMIGVGYVAVFVYNLNFNYELVDGTTISYIQRPGTDEIEFEYYFDGQRYTGRASTMDPDLILVPGGRFEVRVTKFKPETGRIDFDAPLSSQSVRQR